MYTSVAILIIVNEKKWHQKKAKTKQKKNNSIKIQNWHFTNLKNLKCMYESVLFSVLKAFIFSCFVKDDLYWPRSQMYLLINLSLTTWWTYFTQLSLGNMISTHIHFQCFWLPRMISFYCYLCTATLSWKYYFYRAFSCNALVSTHIITSFYCYLCTVTLSWKYDFYKTFNCNALAFAHDLILLLLVQSNTLSKNRL